MLIAVPPATQQVARCMIIQTKLPPLQKSPQTKPVHCRSRRPLDIRALHGLPVSMQFDQSRSCEHWRDRELNCNDW